MKIYGLFDLELDITNTHQCQLLAVVFFFMQRRKSEKNYPLKCCGEDEFQEKK